VVLHKRGGSDSNSLNNLGRAVGARGGLWPPAFARDGADVRRTADTADVWYGPGYVDTEIG
jgi:hypothetical protein